MRARRVRVGAVVLAAGEGRRFRTEDPASRNKLLVDLDGRPLLQHVLDVLAEAPLPGTVVVVLGHDHGAIEAAIGWRSERFVRNPAPEDGLSGSLRIGLRALREARPAVDAALIVLGDQPRLSGAVIERLLRAADAVADAAPDRPLVVPRYEGGSSMNPVLLRRSAFGLADELSGDRGLGPLIGARPDLVEWVPVEGSNPDVDTPTDLETISRA